MREKDLEALRPRVKSLVRGYVGHVEAEDVTQDVLVKAWANRLRYDAERSLLNWVLMIAKNVCLDWKRTKARRAETVPMDAPIFDNWGHEGSFDRADTALGPEEILMRKSISPKVKAIVNILPTRQKETVLLVADGVTYLEIARQTNSALGTVRTRVFRARERAKRLTGVA